MRAGVEATPHCVFEYLYRDSSNYKAHGAILLVGAVTAGDLERLTATLPEGLYFLPAAVGIAPLHEELFQYSNGPTADDHPWHEFVCLRQTEPKDMEHRSVAGPLEEFLGKFRS
jgi:hypothetical protein